MTVEEVTVYKGELILKGNYKIHSTSAVRFLGFYEEKKIKKDTLLITLYPDFEGIGKDSKKQAEWHLTRKLNKEEKNVPYVSVKIVGNDFHKKSINQTD
ncbi:MAG: hypothetical protein MUF43_08415 [Flavobacterium sp.]|jgi:hypothetical protein|nr:hypothetical protein [Flavobacterium sp.]